MSSTSAYKPEKRRFQLNRVKTLTSIFLIVSFLAVGMTAAKRGSVGSAGQASKKGNSGEVEIQNLTPAIPSKEYVYAGGRLIATEEPQHTVTIGVFDPSTRTFYLRNSNSAGFADVTIANFGPIGAIPVVGDWDGNGTTSIGVYDPSTQTFYLRNSNTVGFADITVQFGPPGAIPVVGDWDGNGTSTIGVYVPGTSPNNPPTFYLRNTNTPGFADITVAYGPFGATPVVGNWDGDTTTNGTTTIGVYDPATRTFYLRNSNTAGVADITVQYGPSGATPFVGDWGGDRSTTIGCYVSDTTFYLRNSNTIGDADLTFQYGPAGATPLAGDWDGL